MTTRPLTIRAHEARAIQTGRLSLIVRPVKPQPNGGPNAEMVDLGDGYGLLDGDHSGEWRCPLGKPGDVLWCRETWAHERDEYEWTASTSIPARKGGLWYAADAEVAGAPWRSPVTMPRSASRFSLRVIDVDCKRVQEISEAEAKATGVDPVYTIAGAWERNEWVWLARVERVTG